jgi:hypothetical protein
VTTKTFQTIPRNVWVLGFVSLLTDISSEMIHSVLPLFLVSVFALSAIALLLVFESGRWKSVDKE